MARGRRRGVATLAVLGLAAALSWGSPAAAAIVPTVPLATASAYSVLGGSTVTNANATVLHGSLGLWPGTDLTGFPPGQVVAPGTTDVTNAAARQAQADLTAAYVDAAGRPVTETTAADLTGRILPGGVYAGPSGGALLLTGPLVLDGAGDPSTVFVFQTGSSLTTATGSTVRLVNGAQECNVFWQVGSSATLGTGSVFAGSILALTSITVQSGVTVHGRALARNGAVTMDGDVFTAPACATSATTTTTADPTTTTAVGGTDGAGTGGTDTAGTDGAGTDGTGTDGSGTDTAATDGAGTDGGGAGSGAAGATSTSTTASTTTSAGATSTSAPGADTRLAKTGRPLDDALLLALAGVGVGLLLLGARERRMSVLS